jgi:hypothetical protein
VGGTLGSPILDFQEEVSTTSASKGMIIEKGVAKTATQGINKPLKREILAAVLRHWNPADTSDLMRFIKDPESGQEWLLYAAHIAFEHVLVLLYLPQTPVTKVRGQTINLARRFSTEIDLSRNFFFHTEETIDLDELPELDAIFDSASDEPVEQNPRNFPVDWFRETELPEAKVNTEDEDTSPEQIAREFTFQQISSEDVVQPDDRRVISHLGSHNIVNEELAKPFEIPDFDPLDGQIIEVVEEIAFSQGSEKSLDNNPELEPDSSSVEFFNTPPANMDLGSFQPVDLLEVHTDKTGLDSMQPVALNVKPEENIENIDEKKLEEPAEKIDPTDFGPNYLKNLNETSVIEEGLQSNPVAITPTAEEEIPSFLLELDSLDDFLKMEMDSRNESNKFDSISSPSEPDEEPKEPINPNQEFEERLEGLPYSPLSQPEDQDQHGVPVEKDFEGSSVSLFNRMKNLQDDGEVVELVTVTAALVPRDESVILTKQIAGTLTRCMEQIAQGFGWKLQNLTIRPTYIQWTVTISPLFSPEDMVSIVRRQSTLQLLHLLKELPPNEEGDDFWSNESMMAIGDIFTPSLQWLNFILRRKMNEIA